MLVYAVLLLLSIGIIGGGTVMGFMADHSIRTQSFKDLFDTPIKK